jgi:serine/threonine protein kinase
VLEAHQRLGEFAVVRRLGGGGMGDVYEAEQDNPRRRVALKVLKPWLTQDEEARERFFREIAVPAELDHPGIVRIIAAGRTDDGLAWYTMHLVRGVSLAQLLRQAAESPQPATVLQKTTTEPGGPGGGDECHGGSSGGAAVLPELLAEYRRDRYRFVVRVGAQAARALAAAHRHGHIHRDIKPSNLMMDRHRQLYLVDFGLVKALEGDGSSTRPGTICGTPWYMSPEQARGEPLDPRTDVYSLGVTLYELAAGGEGPYTARRDDRDSVLRQVRASELLPLRAVAPDVPAGLEKVIARALQHRPGRRYPVAEEMAAELEALEHGLATPPGGRGPGKTPDSSRRWVAPLALAIASLAAVAAGAVYLAGRQAPGDTPAAPPAALLPAEKEAEMPAMLRDRSPNVAVPLLRNDFEPVWPQRIVRGKGYYTVMKRGLNLYAPPGETAFLPLDAPGRHAVEFSVEVQEPRGGATEQGVFLGFRRGDRGRGEFYRVRLVEPEGGRAAFPLLSVDRFTFQEADGSRGDFTSVAPLPGASATLPPRANNAWRRLEARVSRHALAVSVDGVPRIGLDLRKVPSPPWGVAEPPDPRGVLGLWVYNGAVFFRNATTTALPDPDGEE